MPFKSKLALKKENLRLKAEVEELSGKVYENCRSVGCSFCKYGMVTERNGKVRVCCELEQKAFCCEFIRETEKDGSSGRKG